METETTKFKEKKEMEDELNRNAKHIIDFIKKNKLFIIFLYE